MKNFGTLYGYELKKLLKRKLNWIAVLALTAFCVFGVVLSSSRDGFMIPIDDETTIRITAEEQREAARKAVDEFSGRPLDDVFIQEILDNLPELRGLEGFDRELYLMTTDNPYKSPYNRLAEILLDPEHATAEVFYTEQWERTLSYMERHGDSGLSEGEIAWWTAQMEQIQRPFVYQYPWPGTTKLVDYFYTLLTLLPAAAAICVCTVFSEDRRDRVDALVFASKEGRAPLYLAKILAGAAVSALVGLVMVGAVVIAHLAVWGWKGLDACAQMYWHIFPRSAAIWQVLLPMLALLVLYALLCGGLSMLVAAMTRSALAALASPVLLAVMLNNWHPMPYGWAGYLPDNLMGWSGPNNVELVKIFGVYLTNFQFGPILYLGIALILLILCWPFWRRSAKGL